MCIACNAQQKPESSPVEVASIHFGSNWAEVSKSIGAKNIKCEGAMGIGKLEDICTFEITGAKWGTLPVEREGKVGLVQGKVAFATINLPKPKDEAAKDHITAHLKKLATDWNMYFFEQHYESAVLSVDLTKNRETEADFQDIWNATDTPAIWTGKNYDGTIELAMGRYEMFQQYSGAARP